MAYLDHAATTPLRPEAAAELSVPGYANAGSLHGSGRAARRALEEAREGIAEQLQVQPGDVVFTSGGTEADNLAVAGMARAARAENPRRNLVAVSAIEHHAVLDAADNLTREGFEVLRLPVTGAGLLDLELFGGVVAARGPELALVSVMAANNETGARQPVTAVAEALVEVGVALHCDAVQLAGTGGHGLPTGSALSISGHKFGGPIGIGALVIPPHLPCVPTSHGGGQERALRSGTPNVAGAVAMAAALRAVGAAPEACGEVDLRLGHLRDLLVARVIAAVPEAQLNTPLAASVPGILNVGFPGCEGDALLMLLDAAGVEVSTGSACTAGIPRPSHVLLAAGQTSAMASSALRFSLGWTSTIADVEAVASALPEAVARSQRAPRLSGTAAATSESTLAGAR